MKNSITNLTQKEKNSISGGIGEEAIAALGFVVIYGLAFLGNYIVTKYNMYKEPTKPHTN